MRPISRRFVSAYALILSLVVVSCAIPQKHSGPLLSRESYLTEEAGGKAEQQRRELDGLQSALAGIEKKLEQFNKVNHSTSNFLSTLKSAEREGRIRPATKADFIAWLRLYTAGFDLPPVAGDPIMPEGWPQPYPAWVVLKEFTYPVGIEESVDFLIAANSPEPQGHPPADVYDLAIGSCEGSWFCPGRRGLSMPQDETLEPTEGPGYWVIPQSCRFPGALRSNATIFAATASGGTELQNAIDGSGSAARQIEVTVNSPGGATELILTAREPTVWHIGRTKGTNITAVFLSGYHRQVVTGLPGSVPLLISTKHNNGPCGYTMGVFADAVKLNPLSRKLFGAPIKQMFLGTHGAVTLGKAILPGVKLLYAKSPIPQATSATVAAESITALAYIQRLQGKKAQLEKQIQQVKKETEEDRLADEKRSHLPDICVFSAKIPSTAKIVAAETMPRFLERPIDQSGLAAGVIEVSVNAPSEPVALLLSSEVPTIWKIGKTAASKIAAVFVTGSNRQEIIGLPPEVPTLISSDANGYPCGTAPIFQRKSEELDSFSRKLFGRAVDQVLSLQSSYQGAITIGNPLQAGEKATFYGEITAESFMDYSAPRSGFAGIKDAERDGRIRPATKADFMAWFTLRIRRCDFWAEAQQIQPPQGWPASYTSEGVVEFRNGAPHFLGAKHDGWPGPYPAYVILTDFTFPARIPRETPLEFLLPAESPWPSGNTANVNLYDLNSGNRSGNTGVPYFGSSCRGDEKIYTFSGRAEESSITTPY